MEESTLFADVPVSKKKRLEKKERSRRNFEGATMSFARALFLWVLMALLLCTPRSSARSIEGEKTGEVLKHLDHFKPILIS